tara:strand:- start:626 stop:1450 length:825 start_codon:yes stop_codon:yes gene_type:complete
MTEITNKVILHYDIKDISKNILLALREEGIDISSLSSKTLTRMDQFHTRGIKANKELTNLVTPKKSMHILDIGCGIGGPARYLASEYGCRVTGIDLINSYIEVANMLTKLCHLDSLVSFRHANALNLPFNDNSFDMVWCQNVSMNIEDKDTFYDEIARVIVNDGYLVSTEMSAGKNNSPYYPLPWARGPEISFLCSQIDMRTKIESTGLKIIKWKDTSLEAIKSLENAAKKTPKTKLSLSLIAGNDIDERMANAGLSLIDEHLSNITIVAKKNN